MPYPLAETSFQTRLNELEEQFLHAPVESERLLRDLISRAAEAGDHEAEVRATILVGGAMFYQGRFQEVQEYTQKALQMAQDLGDDALKSRVLNGMGLTEQRLGLYGQAFQHYHESLAIARRQRDLPGQVRTLDNLASLYRIFRQFGQAMAFLAEAQELLLRFSHPVYMFTVSRNLIWTHIDAGNYQQAMAIIHLFLPEAQDQQATQFIANFLCAQAHCYLHLGQLKQALCCAEQAVDEVHRHLSVDPDGRSFSILGQVNMALGNDEQAEKYLLLAMDVAEKSGSVRARAEQRALLAAFYEKSGDTEKAFLHTLKYFQMQEQVQSSAL